MKNNPLQLCAAAWWMLAAPAALAAQPPLDESLAWQNLDGRDFHETDLRHHKLSMTSFKRGDFHGADFSGSDLNGTDFDDADLSHTKGWDTVDFGMGLSAQRANFRYADLSRARMTGTYFENADFRNADLREAILAGRFHDANFADAEVRGAVLLGAFGIESQLEELGRRGAIVTAAELVKAIRAGRDFANCELDGIRLDGVNLDDTVLSKVDFGSSSFIEASFIRADLQGADFCNTVLRGVKLMEVAAVGARLCGANLRGADLSHANFANADFSSANLSRANLTGTDLTGVNFSYADLTGANLAGAKLDGVQWENALIANLRGIPPEQAAELKSKAARWKYDLARKFDWLLEQFSIPAWFLCWPLGAICLVRGWRRHANRLPYGLLGGIHVIATVSVLGWLSQWWSWLWFGTLVLLLPGLIAVIPVTLIAWASWGRSSPRPSPGGLALATVLTGISLLAAYGIFIKTAPFP